ncbi:MAG TPA: hypothetical protein VGJ81_03630 [Thermoanaerobaculia bacterium]|jgi:hypothetical protein
MPHPQLDNLVRSGELKAEAADSPEFEGLVSSASKRLRDANNDALELRSRAKRRYGLRQSFWNASSALGLSEVWHELQGIGRRSGGARLFR